MLNFIEIYFIIFFILNIIGVMFFLINEKRKIGIGIMIIAALPMYIALVSFPIFILSGMFENFKVGAFLLFATIVIGYLFTKFGLQIINIIKTMKVNDKSIYVRDIEVEYSPAVLSYLQNQKLETKKDITASILRLCAKGLLAIEKKENSNEYKLKANDKNIENLQEDEKYLYENIKKQTKININEWTRLVKKEFAKYKFAKENEMSLYVIMLLCYFALMFGGMVYVLITGNTTISDEAFNFIMLPFLAAFEIVFIEPVARLILKVLLKGEYLDGMYSTKGALEMNRWNKYKKFLEDYTLIEEKNLESVTILENYIAYAMALNINKSYQKGFISDLNLNYNISFKDIEKEVELALEGN